MIISFDLDDTLIPGTKRFSTESRSFVQKLCGTELIRSGAIMLLRTLQERGHKIVVYTTSYRNTYKVWWTFYLYGIRLDKVINQEIHERTLGEKARTISKYPPAFAIDIHIDDSRGVEIEGQRHNFKTIIVDEQQDHWTDYVLDMISNIEANVTIH